MVSASFNHLQPPPERDQTPEEISSQKVDDTLPPLPPWPIASSVSSDLVRTCSCWSFLASISFLNFCWSCCCRSFLSCLGSACSPEPTASPLSKKEFKGEDVAGNNVSRALKNPCLPGASSLVLTFRNRKIRSVDFRTGQDSGLQWCPPGVCHRGETGEAGFLHRWLTM